MATAKKRKNLNKIPHLTFKGGSERNITSKWKDFIENYFAA